MTESATIASRRASAVLALVIAGTALVVIDITVVAIGLPDIQTSLGGTLADIQWVIIAYTVTMGAVTQAVGTLSDRVGRRRLYLVGVVLFTMASLACGIAPNVVALDAARVVQGLGAAILMTCALPLLSDSFDAQRRTMAITTWGTTSTAAGLVAPLLGGVLVDVLSWRAIFLINVPIGLAVLILALFTLPMDDPTTRTAGPRVDWVGTLLLIGSLATGNFALLRGEVQGWASPLTVGQLTLAGVGLAAFVAIELRVPAPTLELRLFRRPAFTGAALAVFMSRMLTVGGVVYVVQYAQISLELTATQTGLLLAPAFIAQIVTGQLGGKLLATLPPGRVIASGYAAKLVGGIWLGFALAPHISPWLLVFPLLIWGIGGGLAGAPVMAVAMNATDKKHAGMASGTIISLASIGAGLGTAVLGAVYQRRLAHAAATGLPTDEAVAAAGQAALFCSAALAAATIVAVLALLNTRVMPSPQQLNRMA
jgi:EmrB/QacA subfamily drug resistance transporter